MLHTEEWISGLFMLIHSYNSNTVFHNDMSIAYEASIVETALTQAILAACVLISVNMFQKMFQTLKY